MTLLPLALSAILAALALAVAFPVLAVLGVWG